METMSECSSNSFTLPQEPAVYDEFSMQHSLLFSESLKDLMNLREQLYSAAEYFELSYTNDDQKHTVFDTLKDYAIKSLVNTVDHLGAVTYKVNDLFDENADEVSGSELRVSSIEQRVRTCQGYIDQGGFSQQSSVMNIPKYHKRYILPAGETMNGSVRTQSKYQGCGLDEDSLHKFKNAVQATIRETTPSLTRRGRSPSPSRRPSQQPGSFQSMTKNESEKRAASPHRFPLLRSRSTTPNSKQSSRSTSPNPSWPITPSSAGRQRFPSDPCKSASMRLPAERHTQREGDQIPSKSKRLLKALLSRRKTKKDDMLYTYLDEY